jgi:hypothetical protein
MDESAAVLQIRLHVTAEGIGIRHDKAQTIHNPKQMT